MRTECSCTLACATSCSGTATAGPGARAPPGAPASPQHGPRLLHRRLHGHQALQGPSQASQQHQGGKEQRRGVVTPAYLALPCLPPYPMSWARTCGGSRGDSRPGPHRHHHQRGGGCFRPAPTEGAPEVGDGEEGGGQPAAAAPEVPRPLRNNNNGAIYLNIRGLYPRSNRTKLCYL